MESTSIATRRARRPLRALAAVTLALAGCGGDDRGPPAGGSLVAEALRSCAWATGCLNPEESFGGGAPNTNVSSCLATFFDQRAQPVASGATAPWADYRACTASATTCAAFAGCLEGRHAICGAAGDWQKGIECPDGKRSCDGACLASCTGGATTCSGDATRMETCDGGTRRVVGCDMGPPGGACVELGGGANCLPGTGGTCGADAITCDGSTQVVCFGGIENRLDCALAGQTCAAGCRDGTACTYMHQDACTGDSLSACLSGELVDIDCAALGGTCGTLTSGRAGCVFP
jgi:hypothetical protein